MKNLIVSYSFTGNNGLFARRLAKETGADHIQLQEVRKRKIFTIVLDVVFNRTPAVKPLGKELGEYDCVIFVSPIWFGKIATPFRQLFTRMRDTVKSYVFISVSSGSAGIVPHVEPELVKYLGTEPLSVTNHLISDLVPYNQRSNRKILDTYILNDAEIDKLLSQTSLGI